MNSQKLSLAVLFVFGLSIESWASMRDAISEVGAEPENTISAAFVLPEGTAFVLPEGTMLINGKIDSNQDTDRAERGDDVFNRSTGDQPGA